MSDFDPSRDLELTIKITPDLDANAAGEFLLNYINSKERWGYSTREFQRGDFRPVLGVPPLIVRTCCCGCYAELESQYRRIDWYRSDSLNLEIFLHWDGDGTIVIRHPNWMLENGDCKCAYDWEWVDGDHWTADLSKNYYADELGPWA